MMRSSRYILGSSGYLDMRDGEDRWVRVFLEQGDPAGIHHHFTLEEKNYVKAMRLFVGEPAWTAYNRSADHFETWGRYVQVLVLIAEGRSWGLAHPHPCECPEHDHSREPVLSPCFYIVDLGLGGLCFARSIRECFNERGLTLKVIFTRKPLWECRQITFVLHISRSEVCGPVLAHAFDF